MICLAYDGSLNGDWVFRYALRFAAHAPEKALSVFHVACPGSDGRELDEKLERMARECRELEVEPLIRVLEGPDALSSLVSALEPDPQSLVVCGTRVRSRHQSYLAGTVAEKLLYRGRFPVLALRVVHPGLLGNPHRMLIPLAGHPRGFRAAWPFLKLFLPDVTTLHLMRGMPVHHLRHPHLSSEDNRRLLEQGRGFLHSIREEIIQSVELPELHLDCRVVVCDDWPAEVLLHASALKAQMMLIGASERSAARKVLRGNPVERLLRETPCDLGIYRGALS